MNLIRKHSTFLMGLPSFAWLIIFYALPVFLVILLAFKPVDAFGGIGSGWTLETIKNLQNPSYPSIIWRTFWQGIVSTLVCILIAIPVSYQLSRMESRLKNIFLLLIIVPFWTNFLIRIFAWKIFLSSSGFFHHALVWVGVLEPNTNLLYNQWAVLTVMIYTYIPFAILPIYAVAEKFDFSLLDAAKADGMTGFEFDDGKVTLTYRAHQDEPERNMVYAMLTARILKAAKEATRVFPERQEPENEKYFARAWLIRIGYGGADSKAERLLLLKHLKGHSAFPNDDAADRHKEKYAAIRKEKKLAAKEEAAGEGVTTND